MRSWWSNLRESAIGRQPVFARVLPVAFAITVIANLAVTPILTAQTTPLLTHPSGDLATIVETDQWSVKVRLGIYFDLRALAAGRVLVVPPDSFIDAHTARGFADVTVQVVDYDPKVGVEITALDRDPIRRILADERGLDVWYVRGPESDVYWLAKSSVGALIVPASVSPVPAERADG